MATVSEAPHSTKLPPLLADQLHTDPMRIAWETVAMEFPSALSSSGAFS